MKLMELKKIKMITLILMMLKMDHYADEDGGDADNDVWL